MLPTTRAPAAALLTLLAVGAPSAMAAPPLPLVPATATAPAPASTPTSAEPARSPRREGLNRAYVRVRPFYALQRLAWEGDAEQARFGGAIADLGVEANLPSGLLLGAALDPVLIGLAQRPVLTPRLYLGYTQPTLAIGVSVANGTSWLAPQAGPLVRLGRFDGTHAIVRMSWSVYPPRPLPVDASVQIVGRVSPRARVTFDMGGSYGDYIGAQAALGAQLLLRARGGPGTTVLSAGLGAAWVNYSIGPMASLGVEHRF